MSGFRSTTTITGIRIRMSARTYVKIINIANLALIAKNNNYNRALVRKENDLLKAKAMKRIGNLYSQIISVENLTIADEKDRKSVV